MNVPKDRTLGAELDASGDILVEMANLRQDRTGVPGTIFISTAMASHGPRVKYYVRAGRDQQSFSVSISANPELVANSLDQKIVLQVLPAVIEWVKLNHADLLSFWNTGDTWDHNQVHDFINNLKSI